MLPRVLLYGTCFFCVKFAIYSLFLWIPMFMEQSLGKNNRQVANIQSVYEVGAAIGAVILGYFSDKFYSRRSPTVMFSAVLSTVISILITFSATKLS